MSTYRDIIMCRGAETICRMSSWDGKSTLEEERFLVNFYMMHPNFLMRGGYRPEECQKNTATVIARGTNRKEMFYAAMECIHNHKPGLWEPLSAVLYEDNPKAYLVDHSAGVLVP